MRHWVFIYSSVGLSPCLYVCTVVEEAVGRGWGRVGCRRQRSGCLFREQSCVPGACLSILQGVCVCIGAQVCASKLIWINLQIHLCKKIFSFSKKCVRESLTSSRLSNEQVWLEAKTHKWERNQTSKSNPSLLWNTFIKEANYRRLTTSSEEDGLFCAVIGFGKINVTFKGRKNKHSKWDSHNRQKSLQLPSVNHIANRCCKNKNLAK